MKNPAKVAELLSADWYKEQWPRIPPEELDASSVALPHMASDGVTLTATKVLMDKRRSYRLSKRIFAMDECLHRTCDSGGPLYITLLQVIPKRMSAIHASSQFALQRISASMSTTLALLFP